jgi:hypothetical protein
VYVSPRWDSQQIAPLAIGILGQSLENCWDSVGMKYPECLSLLCLFCGHGYLRCIKSKNCIITYVC